MRDCLRPKPLIAPPTAVKEISQLDLTTGELSILLEERGEPGLLGVSGPGVREASSAGQPVQAGLDVLVGRIDLRTNKMDQTVCKRSKTD